jgi:hypothetical protein
MCCKCAENTKMFDLMCGDFDCSQNTYQDQYNSTGTLQAL